jgi:hypothetical protein
MMKRHGLTIVLSFLEGTCYIGPNCKYFFASFCITNAIIGYV